MAFSEAMKFAWVIKWLEDNFDAAKAIRREEERLQYHKRIEIKNEQERLHRISLAKKQERDTKQGKILFWIAGVLFAVYLLMKIFGITHF